MVCCPCMGEQANNSALGKLTLSFPKIYMVVLQDWSNICQRRVPEIVSQQKVSYKDTGDCKRKEPHLMRINDLSHCVSPGVTYVLEIRCGIQATLNMDIGKISC